MSRSEFRWNKKRKHYAYLFKDKGKLILNVVITTKPVRFIHGKPKANIKLYKHPNPNCHKEAYIIPYVYLDELLSFYSEIYKWSFNVNDKRIIKRIKKRFRSHKKSQHWAPTLKGRLWLAISRRLRYHLSTDNHRLIHQNFLAK